LVVVSEEATNGQRGVGVRPLLVSARQAAELLGIGRTTLYELIGRGAIVPVRIGRCVRFPVRELEAFVEELAVSAERRV
jgi:excisionase family DNA binding protein